MYSKLLLYTTCLLPLVTSCQTQTSVYEQVLSDHWQIAPSTKVSNDIRQLTESKPGTSVWIDAKVPTSVPWKKFKKNPPGSIRKALMVWDYL